MKTDLNSVLKAVANVVAPHLSKGLGMKKPYPTVPWREDSRPLPQLRTFDPKSPDSCSLGQKAQYVIDTDMRRPFRVLCLDGGGVRGQLTISILRRIIAHNPNFMDQVDMICGTSAGGILSLLLAAGYTPAECDDIYSFSMPHIFAHNPWRVINPFRSKYSDKAKQELMQHYFGERKMGDLDKCCSVISFRLDGRKSDTHSFFDKEGWRPAVFTNMPKVVS